MGNVATDASEACEEQLSAARTEEFRMTVLIEIRLRVSRLQGSGFRDSKVLGFRVRSFSRERESRMLLKVKKC